MASRIPALFFSLLLLLLAPHLGSSSYHTNSDQSRTPQTPTCSSVPSGRGNGQLPVYHRLSPCSPLGVASDQSKISVGDAFRLRWLFGEDSESAPAPGASAYAPAPSPGVSVTVPTTGTPLVRLPGASEYHAVASFGTPDQKFTVGFDTATTGASLLQCKPCVAGEPCDQAFDPSLSSSLAQVPCGSPDCPINACSGPSCTLAVVQNGVLRYNVTVVTDTLTLSPSTTVENFRFACLEMGIRTRDSSSGILDLSRNSHSLASRAPSSPDTVAFSYCLPGGTTEVGFLSIGATRPERSGRKVSYTTLRSIATNPNLYSVQILGISVGVVDIPIPLAALVGDSLMELHTTFTYLNPDVYAALRDQFRQQMTQYRLVPSPVEELDTCYDFTGLNGIDTPIITLKFAGGGSLELDTDQFMYYKERGNYASVGCLAFAALPSNFPVVAIIGTHAQLRTEMVYDVRGGKVGFVPDSC